MEKSSSTAQEKHIVLLGGEGIGIEVVAAASKVISILVPNVELLRPDHGELALQRTGEAIPEATKEICRSADAVLFGATWKNCGPVLQFLRWGLETYANYRPAKSRSGIASHFKKDAPIDVAVVRENLEGEYPSREGNLSEFESRWPSFTDILGHHLPSEGKFAIRVVSETGTRRIAEFAS